MSELLGRIEREAGVPGLTRALSELPPSDLRSVLLKVMQAQAARRDPAEVLAQYERDGTCAPEAADARVMHRLNGLALDAAFGFESVELAPVGPLGINALLGDIDQNNLLSTIRNTEVLGDPTSSLALESARRRRAGQERVRLSTVTRVMRLQPFDMPGYTPHFRLFALTSAGRAQPDHGFELAEVVEHIRVYQRLLASLGLQGDVELSDTRLPRPEGTRGAAHRAVAGTTVQHPPDTAPRLLHRLAEALPEARFDLQRPEGIAYYEGPLLRITITDAEGIRYPIGDGGAVTWTQRLLSNRKERLITSGFGLGLIAARFLSRGAGRGPD